MIVSERGKLGEAESVVSLVTRPAKSAGTSEQHHFIQITPRAVLAGVPSQIEKRISG